MVTVQGRLPQSLGTRKGFYSVYMTGQVFTYGHGGPYSLLLCQWVRAEFIFYH